VTVDVQVLFNYAMQKVGIPHINVRIVARKVYVCLSWLAKETYQCYLVSWMRYGRKLGPINSGATVILNISD
jgi:hypothetical protein